MNTPKVSGLPFTKPSIAVATLLEIGSFINAVYALRDTTDQLNGGGESVPGDCDSKPSSPTQRDG